MSISDPHDKLSPSKTLSRQAFFAVTGSRLMSGIRLKTVRHDSCRLGFRHQPGVAFCFIIMNFELLKGLLAFIYLIVLHGLIASGFTSIFGMSTEDALVVTAFFTTINLYILTKLLK